MNLAPIRYARILREQGGPIERIELCRLKIDGVKYYQANTYLSRHLNLHHGNLEVFGDADGTGTHRSAMMARFISISESLERWAFVYLNQIGHKRTYGFNIDGTTTGMAAYPGVLAGQARKRAYREAVERYCLRSWWEGTLSGFPLKHDSSSADGMVIENPVNDDPVVLLWGRGETGKVGYGTACGGTLKEAVVSARIEMDRSIRVLDKYFSRQENSLNSGQEKLRDFMERKIVKFSTREGHQKFLDRLSQPRKASVKSPPKPIIDCNIPGPWQRYASVWRVVFPTGEDYLQDDTNSFLF